MSQRFTIDDLARQAGMTVRNVREYQTKGLLPPPEVSGRVGWYAQTHLARLRLIRDLQAEGLNLQAIAWLLDRAPAEAIDEVDRFKQALFAPWTAEEPVVYATSELAELVGGPLPPDVLERGIELDLIRPVGEDRWEVPSPRLVEAGRQLAALGITAEQALDVLAALREHAAAVARTFVKLYSDQVWRPFEEADMPAEQWPHVREALERLRPLASEALAVTFQQAMATAVGTELADLAPELSEDRASA